MHILFLTASIKKYDGRISSPIVDSLETFGSVSVMETDHRTATSQRPSRDSRRAPQESGVALKRIATVSPGFYINPTSEKDEAPETPECCFARIMRDMNCVVVDARSVAHRRGISSRSPLLSRHRFSVFINNSPMFRGSALNFSNS